MAGPLGLMAWGGVPCLLRACRRLPWPRTAAIAIITTISLLLPWPMLLRRAGRPPQRRAPLRAYRPSPTRRALLTILQQLRSHLLLLLLLPLRLLITTTATIPIIWLLPPPCRTAFPYPPGCPSLAMEGRSFHLRDGTMRARRWEWRRISSI